MGMFGGGFSHGLGIDDATTGRGRGGYGEVGGRSFGNYMSDNSRASRQRLAARDRARAAAAKEAARVAAVKAEQARAKEAKRVIVERDVRLAYEAAQAISDNFNNSLVGGIASLLGINKAPSPSGGGVIDTRISFNPLSAAIGLFSAPLAIGARMIGLPQRLGIPDITLASIPGGIDTPLSLPTINTPALTASPGIDAGFTVAGLSGGGSAAPATLVAEGSSVFASSPPPAATMPEQATGTGHSGASVFSGVSVIQKGPALRSGAIPGPQPRQNSQKQEKQSVWPELITAAVVAAELS